MSNPITAKLSKYYQDRLKFLSKQTNLSANPLLKPPLRVLVSKSMLNKKTITEKNKQPTQKQNSQKKKSAYTFSNSGIVETKHAQKKRMSIMMPKSSMSDAPESKRYTIDNNDDEFFGCYGNKFKKYSESCQNFYKKQKLKANKTTIQSGELYLPTKRSYRHKRLYSALPYKKSIESASERSCIINKDSFRRTIREIPKQQILLGWETDKVELENVEF